jgi:hypothetical protein
MSTEESVEEEAVEPVFKIFLSEDTFGYETDLSPEETVFWLDVVKTNILNKVTGGDNE